MLSVRFSRATAQGRPCQETETEHVISPGLDGAGAKDWITHRLFWARLGKYPPHRILPEFINCLI